MRPVQRGTRSETTLSTTEPANSQSTRSLHVHLSQLKISNKALNNTLIFIKYNTNVQVAVIIHQAEVGLTW